ncbi:MAG: DUF1761 domain-containing protein [Bacteroidota bacterium]|nr:DUF1761 domain-containing protein [Bacteroidota bacterium]
MDINFLVIALAALIPLAVGMIYYNPKVLGNAWMASAGLTEEQLKGANMGLIFGLTYVFSFLIAFSMQFTVIHQFHMMSVLTDEPGLNDPTSAVGQYYADFLATYGQHFRTFKHGVFHGVLSTLFFIMPVIGINALFERKKFKYIAIHTGFWAICLGLIGGIISAWA